MTHQVLQNKREKNLKFKTPTYKKLYNKKGRKFTDKNTIYVQKMNQNM